MPIDDAKQTWSLGISCYNEEATIAKVVDDVQKVLKRISTENEILIVDDQSTDRSRDIIRGLEQEHANVRAIYHDKNLGIGGTIRDIYFNAKYENVTFIPGDAQFDPGELLPYANVEEKTFISFYRQENLVYSSYRKTLSFLNKLVNRTFIGLEMKDVNWVKVYKRKELENLDIMIKSSIIESEICAKLNILGYRPIEVLSKYHPRVAGKSRGASFKNVMRVSFETVKLFGSVRQFRMKAGKNSPSSAAS
jgi:glycosyltransferase involved in cell wall biosynthesis